MLDNWHNIAKQLSESHTVYAIDARNHGQSPHSSEMGYDVMADDTIELADSLNIDKFVLMGHSMGGKTAMHIADKYPERIEKLIVVDIAPKAYKPGHVQYFKAFEEIDWRMMSSRKDIDEALSKYEENVGIRLFLAKNIDRHPEGGFTVKSNMSALKSGYEEIIGPLELKGVYAGPSLFVTGEKSKYLQEEDKPYIALHFPNTEYKKIPNAGHWVHADNPAEFLEVLIGFLG